MKNARIRQRPPGVGCHQRSEISEVLAEAGLTFGLVWRLERWIARQETEK